MDLDAGIVTLAGDESYSVQSRFVFHFSVTVFHLHVACLFSVVVSRFVLSARFLWLRCGRERRVSLFLMSDVVVSVLERYGRERVSRFL